jgi:uncharacterized membrane protein
MRKGFDHLFLALILFAIASFSTKIGAITTDSAIYILISYSIGSIVAFTQYSPHRKKLKQKTKEKSLKWGIIIGILNFLSYFAAVEALAIGPGSLIWPILGLNIVAIVGISMVVFKERLNRNGVIGVILAVISILLLR